jgi:SWI/SNF-related matrix-associated actin-dependent regulator 1 of chromatin subfamily A
MSNNLFADIMAGIVVKEDEQSITAVLPQGVTITPVDLALPLHDYQREALAHVFRDPTKPYGYIGLDMGLGKTPVGLGVAAAAHAAGITPSLIVVPPSLRTNWVREAQKFTPWLTVEVLSGRAPEDGFTLPKVDVLILGDSSLAGWHEFLMGKVGALIVDEAHRYKNKSGRSEALVALANSKKKVKDQSGRTRLVSAGLPAPQIRVPMSGTPSPNGRNAELAQQVSIMGDEAWADIGGKGRFWNRYAPQVDSWGGRGSTNSEELHESMSGSWFFRRLRDDVVELPNKGRTALHLDGQGRKVKEYIRAEDDLIAWLADRQDGKVTQGQIRAEALIRMTALRRLAGECKVKSIIEHVKDVLEDDDSGVFIVAEHGDVMDDLLIGLSKYNPSIVRGGMTDAEKDAEVQAFITGETRVMVGQITAAGVGLTLHGDGKNRRVVVAQLPWTPAELRQAEDRLHRLGQTRDVLVEVALCAIDGRWTIDERLWGLLEAKNFSASTLVDGEGEFLLQSAQEGVLDTYR